MKLHQLQLLSHQSSESGFTIIESLVAILVAGFLLAAIAPVIVLSTATRVQGRRVELATQAAKAFVDAIQAKTISDPPIDPTLKLDPATADQPRTFSDSTKTKDYLLSSVDPPADKNNLYCFNKSGIITLPADCTSEVQFYIQAFRSAVTDSDPDKGQGYRLGIRVYRSDAEFGSLTKTAEKTGQGNDTKKIAATFTGGLGDRKAPLVEMTTEIVRGQPSYNALCARLGGCN